MKYQLVARCYWQVRSRDVTEPCHDYLRDWKQDEGVIKSIEGSMYGMSEFNGIQLD